MTPSQAKGICGVRNQDHGYPLVGGVATRRRYKGGLLGALNVLFLSLSLGVNCKDMFTVRIHGTIYFRICALFGRHVAP